MTGTLRLRDINKDNEYEVELLQYNNTNVKVLGSYGDSYEVETYDGSEYTIYKDELINKQV